MLTATPSRAAALSLPATAMLAFTLSGTSAAASSSLTLGLALGLDRLAVLIAGTLSLS
jgi:hypothetical protein